MHNASAYLLCTNINWKALRNLKKITKIIWSDWMLTVFNYIDKILFTQLTGYGPANKVVIDITK